jgi:hypothetical protein
MRAESLAEFAYPGGSAWVGVVRAPEVAERR